MCVYKVESFVKQRKHGIIGNSCGFLLQAWSYVINVGICPVYVGTCPVYVGICPVYVVMCCKHGRML